MSKQDTDNIDVITLDTSELPEDTKILRIDEALAHTIGWRDSLRASKDNLSALLESTEALVDTPSIYDRMPEDTQMHLLDTLRTMKGDIAQMNQMVDEADKAFRRLLGEMNKHSINMFRLELQEAAKNVESQKQTETGN